MRRVTDVTVALRGRTHRRLSAYRETLSPRPSLTYLLASLLEFALDRHETTKRKKP